MLTSRKSSSSTVTDVDTKFDDEKHRINNKKRGRLVSRLFEVSRHAKKMSNSSRQLQESTTSSPTATTPYSRTSEPSTKRVLRDIVVAAAESSEMQQQQQQQPDVIFVTSSPSESWKEEMAKLTRSIQYGGSTNHQEDEWKDARNLASSIIRAWVIRPGTGSLSTVIPGADSFAERNKRDCLSCPKCGGVLYQVVTLACGHSFCRKCANGLDHCYKCNRADHPAVQPDQLKTNVTVSTLVSKWWADELRAVELRNAGNQAFTNQHYDQALEKYTQAAQSGTFSLKINIFRRTCLFFGIFEINPVT
jgi:hypothetical protein